MTRILSAVILSIFVTACSHQASKENYSPVVAFEQNGMKYNAKVELPKKIGNKVPLVVIIHEWWGRNPYIMKRSQMLNEQGYATLAVDLYGDNQVVGTPAEAQALATPFYQNPNKSVELLNKYLEIAKNDPHVDSSKIFVIGYCFGGTQALNLARSGSDVKGVVSFHGGLATSMKSENIKARVLALNGEADPMVPVKEVIAFEEEMKGLRTDYRVVNYKGALHAFTNPDATAIGKKFKIPVAYNKAADEASWKELLAFLQQ